MNIIVILTTVTNKSSLNLMNGIVLVCVSMRVNELAEN